MLCYFDCFLETVHTVSLLARSCQRQTGICRILKFILNIRKDIKPCSFLDRSGKLENNRFKEAGTLISICTPPCMGKTIAAVFLNIRMSRKAWHSLFAYRLSLSKDFLRGICCLAYSCYYPEPFRTCSLLGGAPCIRAKCLLHEGQQLCARGVFRSQMPRAYCPLKKQLGI